MTPTPSQPDLAPNSPVGVIGQQRLVRGRLYRGYRLINHGYYPPDRCVWWEAENLQTGEADFRATTRRHLKAEIDSSQSSCSPSLNDMTTENVEGCELMMGCRLICLHHQPLLSEPCQACPRKANEESPSVDAKEKPLP